MTLPGDESGIICVTLNPAIDRTYEVHSLELGQHAKGRLLSVHPAGKAVNVARVLEHLGRRCILTGFVGDGERRLFESSFDSSLVRAQLFGISQRTRENVTLMDVERGMETHIRDEGGAISTDDRSKLVRKLKILCRGDNLAVFAGSLPKGIGHTEILEMLVAVDRAGSRIVLDSSGGMRAALGRVPVWLMKPNQQELAELTGEEVKNEATLLAAGRKILEHTSMLLVSAGEKGCYLLQQNETLHAYMKSLPRPIASTVGCGDALLAGFLEAVSSGKSPRESLKQAVAVATSALFHVRAGDIDPAEATSLAGKVTVYQIG